MRWRPKSWSSRTLVLVLLAIMLIGTVALALKTPDSPEACTSAGRSICVDP